jgi:MFS family permease
LSNFAFILASSRAIGVPMELKNKQRIFLGAFFFFSGFCFSSWASRIPTIKTFFDFNEAELGTVLLFMPVSSLIGLPVSGWLISRYDSRIPLTAAFCVLSLALCGIGFANNNFTLIASLCIFSFSTRIFNIAVNTQAITLQKQFDRKINGSFHGLWSSGGIAGVGFCTLLVALHVSIAIHLLIVCAIALTAAFISFPHLLRNDRAKSGNKLQLSKPDLYIVYLGLLVFLAAITEGGMFDWSGIFFKEVVDVEIFTLGYLIFMIFMALSRFASDRVIEAIGMRNTYILSSSLIVIGIALAVVFPTFWITLLGFCLVGLGTASVIPMTYLLAGNSKKYSPGMAISIIATYGIVGMLLGPPLIGYIAHASNLRYAFITFALTGVAMIPISRLFFKVAKADSMSN